MQDGQVAQILLRHAALFKRLPDAVEPVGSGYLVEAVLHLLGLEQAQGTRGFIHIEGRDGLGRAANLHARGAGQGAV
ncbi:hypothetical protein SDC9_200273 [bioreactor metagenome]|uniref:Uncharacterized protein n=1 Tax=bioreactor metagenome TaxID=1076179 RepID=A0A645IMT6_9ZZZZ